MKKYAGFKVLICMVLISSCGDVPADGSLATLNNDLVSGIVQTDAEGRILRTFGQPSKGGDADGKHFKCEIDSSVSNLEHNYDIKPGVFNLEHPYPNPTTENAYIIRFTVGCQTDVRITVWEASATEWLLSPGSSMAIVTRPNGRKISEAYLENIVPGIHSYYSESPRTINYVGSDYSFNGFYRVMVTAPGFKAWRDVAVFEDACKAPRGIGLDDFC